MSESDNEATPRAGLPLPSRTTPTWEMELLLSGATVFALFQLAGWIAGQGFELIIRMEGIGLTLTLLGLVYGQGAVVLLVCAFMVHLLLRAYWVALIGLHSIFPHGLKEDGLRAGPIARELLARRWVDIGAVIERADNRATMVFAMGIATALFIIPVTIFAAVLFGIAFALAFFIGDMALAGQIYGILGGLIIVPILLAQWLDRWKGATLPPDSWRRRVLAAVLSASSRIGMAREGNPLVSIFSSNIGERRGTVIVMTAMTLALFVASLPILIDRDDLGLGSYGGWPSPRSGMSSTSDGRHYASSFEPGLTPPVPYVPDRVAAGDYLPLIVPYVPSRHRHLLDACVDADDPPDTREKRTLGGEFEDAAKEDARRAPILACLTGHFQLSLDGVPLAIAPEWFNDPRRDLRGVLYMIDVRSLTPGRHELAVLAGLPPASGDDEDEEASGKVQPHRIPFWR